MKDGTVVLVTTVLVVMCVVRISTGVVYTCPDTLSLCPQAYATCSCTIISSSYVKYNQWYLSMPLCKGQIIQLLHNGTNCTRQYQQCGSIRAWNEPQSNPSSVGNIICETTTLLINAHPNLADLKFNCRSAANTAPYGSTTLNIIAPPDAPNITAVYRLSPTQLTVVWSPASSGGPSTSFSVSISESVNASLMSTAIVGADGKSQEYSYTFTRLARGTTYTVSVVAINCAGNSSPVNYTGVTAFECQDGTIYSNGMLAVYGQTNLVVITPPDAPNITAVSMLSPTQLTVVWSPESSGSPSTSFSVSISAEGINASLMNIAIVGADGKSQEYSYTFTRLARGTTYTVSVVAINCAGNSSPVNQTGATAHPDTPNITAVYSLSPTQLTVVWSPASTGSFPTSFSVRINAEGINASLMSTAIVGADERSHTFLGLAQGTPYTMSVVAINCAGNSGPVNYTGVTGLVCSSILQKDDIIMIAATIGGAVLVLITVSILCTCICIRFYYKHRKQKPEFIDDTNRPPDDEESLMPREIDTSDSTAPTPVQPVNPPALPQHVPSEQIAQLAGLLEISPHVQTPPHESPPQCREPLGPPTLQLLMYFPASGGNINIIQDIGANYNTFGIFLLNDDNGAKVDRLEHDNHSNAEKTTKAIFRTWLQGGVREWSTLVDALRKGNLITLANQVEVVTKEH